MLLMNSGVDRLNPELQLNRPERLTSRREANKSNCPARQSDNSVPAGQSNDRILLNRAGGSQRRVHDQSVLGEFWGDRVPVLCPAGGIWRC